MRSFHQGAHRASADSVAEQPLDATSSRRRGNRLRLTVLSLIAGLVLTTVAPAATGSPSAAAASNYLLMPRSELLKLPTSGTAWSNLVSIAKESLGSPNLCDQENRHGVRALASALVYARTGNSTFGSKARAAVMAALPTLRPGCNNAILSLGRQLGAYVLAADFADLAGSHETTFRSFLSTVRSRDLGGHSVWRTLKGTHVDAQNNWGAFAGASRIAASLYIGDSNDVAIAARVLRGFLGDRSAFQFKRPLDATQRTWSCSSSSTAYAPTNGGCSKSGINVDGAIVTDIARGGSLRWPPGDTGISYVLESMQGLVLQAELLYRNGYGNAWTWSNYAIKRIAGIVTRSGKSGGLTWNHSSAKRHLTWMLNRRYGLSLPRQLAGFGRVFGYTDWLYGSGSSSSPSPTPAPTPTPSAPAPVVTAPMALLSKTSPAVATGVSTVVDWSLKSSSDGVRRYDLQVQKNGGSWSTVKLPSATASSVRYTLGSAKYRFRARAIDRDGRVGGWVYGPTTWPASIGETNAAVKYGGSWSTASHGSYLGDRVRYTRSSGATATIGYTGRSFQWIGPVGPGRGKAQVFVDGVYKQTVDTYASSFVARRVLFAINLHKGWHKVVIKALGTSGRPMVAFDAGQFITTP